MNKFSLSASGPALVQRLGFWLAALCWLLAGSVGVAGERGQAALTFEKEIRPILRAHCLDCHGAQAEKKGGLDLRLRRLMLSGGDSGAAIVPGKSAESFLVQRVVSGEMPPGDARLSPAEIDTLKRWIDQGAVTARPEPEQLGEGLGITAEERAFWSFQPLRRPVLPELAGGLRAQARTPIDQFLLAEMQRQHAGQLGFSPEADRATLLKRVYLDLLGLPPTHEEIQRFQADRREDAYERWVDQLLSSPRYGERWGRHWLDVAGYADSEGATNQDDVRPYAHHYRDYVIRALNADKPFDRFLAEQLAGDELVPPPHRNLDPESLQTLAATGFLRMAADGTGTGGADQDLLRNQVMADTLKIVSSSVLGLTVACAQCHDHRYDPISQEDYYRLRAIFEPALNWKGWRTPAQRRFSLYTDADRELAAKIDAEAAEVAAERGRKQAEYMEAALRQELGKYPEPLRAELEAAYRTPGDKRDAAQQALLKQHPSVNITPGVLYQYNQAAADDLKKYDQRIAEIRARKPVEDFLRVLQEPPVSAGLPETQLFHRGDHRQPLRPVTPAPLAITSPPESRPEFTTPANGLATSGRRLAWARWLTAGRHPLVGRVLANRLWMHHFGRGLVGTPADFGRLGESPSHPQLLDWLACELADRGWSWKRFHRLVVTSAVYRQDSRRGSQGEQLDPDNLLYWHKPVRRLEAEVVRDRMLSVAGRLSGRMFGPPVAIEEDDTGQVVVAGNSPRRSLYVQVRRSQPVAVLAAFDAPAMLDPNCEQRPSSTVATQSLLLMNSGFALSQAEALAQRVAASAELAAAGDSERLHPAWVWRSPAASWQFGWGEYSESAGRTVHFQPLPHWTGSAWQGGPQLPDSTLGWALLTATGGHAGNDAQHAVIRRWTLPAAARVSLRGRLQHGSEQGNGVRGRLVSGQRGLLGEWVAHHAATETASPVVELAAGDTLDWIVDCRDDVGYDSFQWQFELLRHPVEQAAAAAAAGGDQTPSVWVRSQEAFFGPSPAAVDLGRQIEVAWQLAYARSPTSAEFAEVRAFLERQLDTLAQRPDPPADPARQVLVSLCHILLGSNEFIYSD